MRKNMKKLVGILVMVSILCATFLSVNASEISNNTLANENEINIEKEIEIVYQKGIFCVFQFKGSDRQVFCLDRKKTHPENDAPYMTLESIDNLNLENLKKAYYVIETDRQDIIDYRIAAQCLVWAALEDSNFENWAILYGNANAREIYRALQEEYDALTEWEEYHLEYYISSTYLSEKEQQSPLQRIGTYSVPAKKPIEDTKPDTTIENIETEEVPEIPEQPEPTVSEEIETTPKAPQTGDTYSVIPYASLSLSCVLVGITFIILAKKKKF